MIIEVFPPGIKGFVLSIQALIIQGVSLNYKLQTFRKGSLPIKKTVKKADNVRTGGGSTPVH